MYSMYWWCSIFAWVCEVPSDTPCSILSGCVSTLVCFFLFIPPALSPPSFFAALTSIRIVLFSFSVQLFPPFVYDRARLSVHQISHTKGLLTERAALIFRTKLASSCLLASISSASSSLCGKTTDFIVHVLSQCDRCIVRGKSKSVSFQITTFISSPIIRINF